MGPDKFVEDLRRDLAKRQVLVVVGTGVSRQSTGDEECARWDGLIGHGVRHCVGTHNLSADEGQTLLEQLEKGSVDERLTVAERVSEALRAPHDGEFRRWLGESVGRLRAKDRAIIDAVHATAKR